jgi:hypothetical protein
MLEPERTEQFARPRRSLRAGLAGDQLRQEHVLLGAEVRQQVVELVDEAEVLRRSAVRSPEGRSLASIPAIAIRPPKPPSSRPDRLEHGRLAGARRAEQRDELARHDLEVRLRAARRSAPRPARSCGSDRSGGRRAHS